jgi:hypothetical protein
VAAAVGAALFTLPATAATAATAKPSAKRALARSVAIFYYPWFGTVARDGAWQHWAQGGARPPASVASSFFPARGPYSSSDPAVVAAHMNEIAGAGIDTVIVSWWGRGSVEDARLPDVIAAANARGLRVAIHLEPYRGRTVASVEQDVAYLRTFGITDFYVWASTWLPDAEWKQLNERLHGVRLLANTPYAARAAAGGFAGLYTYDVLLYDGSQFSRMCEAARRLRLVCAPSVGPGYDAQRATTDRRVRSRRAGRTYDHMWASALRAGADIVTITSYNEWHEGTQIEPARNAGEPYKSYEGAWGKTGPDAAYAYLDRTAWWTAKVRASTLLSVSRAQSPAAAGRRP